MTRSEQIARGVLAVALGVALSAHEALGQDGGRAQEAQMMQKLVQMAPYRGYLESHGSIQDPPALLGGALTVSVTQASGGVYIALPAHRELDENVFGTPDLPRAFAGTPGIDGMPPAARHQDQGRFTTADPLTPFGNEFTTMGGAHLELDLTDATAFDAETSNDRVRLEARWQDAEGNTYEVVCCQMLATRGVEYPTFGGVVTNHILHGSSRIGTALMPTEYVYAAFWGMGRVRKNGEDLQGPRLVHGMLTEYVRTGGYHLAKDAEVTPAAKQFHLIVPPFMPNMQGRRFDPSPTRTGFTLPNGQPLTFWHVMFDDVEVSADRG